MNMRFVGSLHVSNLYLEPCHRELPLDSRGCGQINCLYVDVWSISNWLYSGTSIMLSR